MTPIGAAWRKTVRASSWALGSGGSQSPADVWSRAGRKHRHRAAVLLAVDLLLFAGLCLFTYWLRTGLYLPLGSPEYWSLLGRSFSVSGPDQVSVTDMLVWPINVERTPLQVVVVALVMAALVSVPILVSILYRFPFAVPFCALIAFVAVMPWLGITGVGACALASLRPFRMGFRFGSALLGLVPFGAYLWLSSRSMQAPPLSGPIDQFKLCAPWFLSLLAACINFAAVLSVASIVGYRPGAIAPVLAVLFAMPIGLFEARIGQDELYYSILETNYGPASRDAFRAQTVAQLLQQYPDLLGEHPKVAALREPRAGGGRDLMDEIHWQWQLGLASVEPLKQAVESLATRILEEDRGEVLTRTERFIADFPNSPRVPAALYLQGRALDMRLDLRQLRGEGVITFYDDFPGRVSVEGEHAPWRALAGTYPDHLLATVAIYKLAVQAVRRGDAAEAVGLLSKVQVLADQWREQRRPADGWFAILLPARPEVQLLGVDVQEVAQEARNLLELVRANAQDPRYGIQPLSDLLRVDPRHPLYRRNLERLDRLYPGSLLHDNLSLLVVLTNQSVSVRIAELARHLETCAGTDSIAQATYERGRLLEDDARLEEAVATYESLPAAYAGSVWADLAAQRVAVLKLRLGK